MRRLLHLLFFAGIPGIVLALAKVHATFIGEYDLTGSRRFAWSGAYALIQGIAAYGAGLPDLPRSARGTAWAALGAALAGAAAMSMVQLFAGDALLPRFVVLGTAAVLPAWYGIGTLAVSGGRARAEARDRLLLIADEREAAALRAELGHRPERPASVSVHLTPDQARSADDRQPLVDAAADATVVVLDRVAQAHDDVVAQAAELHERGIRVRTLTGFYEDWLGKLPLAELERASLFFDIGEVHRARYVRLKRILDLVLALPAAAVLALVTPLVAVANQVGNRGPLLYRQPRVGKGGEIFTIVKFRTMRPRDGGELVNEWTATNDPRITPFGSVLRHTHLDELPQVVNVLRGDLSIVGPRPEQPRYVDQLAGSLPFYQLRHMVRPGLTGWAQVKYGYAGSEADSLEKLQYEFWYLRHQGIGTDLRIVGRTLRTVLGRGGPSR